MMLNGGKGWEASAVSLAISAMLRRSHPFSCPFLSISQPLRCRQVNGMLDMHLGTATTALITDRLNSLSKVGPLHHRAPHNKPWYGVRPNGNPPETLSSLAWVLEVLAPRLLRRLSPMWQFPHHPDEQATSLRLQRISKHRRKLCRTRFRHLEAVGSTPTQTHPR